MPYISTQVPNHLTLAEFTNHQRDVFCVFSGNQVGRFREFLKSATQFQELRDSISPPLPRIRPAPNRIVPATASALPTAFEETYDDEMGDDDNDFDGMYTNDMIQHPPTNNAYMGNAFQPQNGLPAMAHSLPILPGIDTLPWDLPNSLADGAPYHPGPFTTTQQHAPPQHHPQQLPLPTISSFLNNDTSYGNLPLTAYGLAQASMAGPSQPGLRQASTASAATATGASTAQMHQQIDDDEQEHMTG